MSKYSPLDSLVTVTEEPQAGPGRRYLLRRPGMGRPVTILVMADGYAEAIERDENGEGTITAQYPVTPEFAEMVQTVAAQTAAYAALIQRAAKDVNTALRASTATIEAQRAAATDPEPEPAAVVPGWHRLTETQQRVLKAVAAGTQPKDMNHTDTATARRLFRQGYIVRHEGRWVLATRQNAGR